MKERREDKKMERPKLHESYIAKAAAEDLLPDLMGWADAGESERLNYLDDAVELMGSAFVSDGYQLAKILDRKGYDPDSRLVEILENAYSLLQDAHTRAVKEWVKGWNVQVPWQVGQTVQIKHKGKTVDGEVVAIRADEATCTVLCPSLGHVRKGLGTNGLIINSEDVRAVELEAAGQVPLIPESTEAGVI